MKHTSVSIATAALLTFWAGMASAQWVNINGLAASYDDWRSSTLTVDYTTTTGLTICFHDADDPVYNLGGDYRLVVDGRYVTLTGVNAGDAWVTAQLLDKDVKKAVDMLKEGNEVVLGFCSPYLDECHTIFHSSLDGSARAINNVTP